MASNQFKVKNGLIVDQGGASITGSSSISGSLAINASGSSVFTVDGTSGRLFSVDDSLSGSLFSVNTAAGLPVIEAFSDNTVRVGQYGKQALFVSQSKVGIGKENALNGILDISGSVTITGSVIATSFTGSLFGTSSWANNATTASFASTASSADNFTVRGTLTAQTLVVQTITSSVSFITGSTKFGSSSSNTHQFTGSVSITGSLTADSLIKSGGTSGQFLKADGTVDSTAYGTGSVTSVGLSSATSGVTIGATPVTTSGTITLAIATATGSQNGLLSSTDWTTFNGKQNAITLTTTGTSGAATLVGATLNIPNYADQFVGTVTSVAALTLGTTGTDLSSTVANGTTTPVITLNVPTASATNRGALSSADWSTFNGKESVLTFSSPLVRTTNTISIPAATTSVNGYLSSADWTTFNNKQNTITNPVTGTGTTNYLPKWTSGSAIGNSAVSDDGTIILATNRSIQTTGNGNYLRVGNYLWAGGSGGDYGSVGYNQGYTTTTNTYNYVFTDYASILKFDLGGFKFLTAPSGTAGNAITFTQAMTLNAGGRLLVGTTSDDGSNKLQVNGGIISNVETGFTALLTLKSGNGESYISETDGNLNMVFVNKSTFNGGANISDMRFCTNNNTTTPALILALSGAATFSSSVTASSLIKSGGTSSQFLMADGSVNTSVLPSGAYLPLAGGTLTGALDISTSTGTNLTYSLTPAGWNGAKHRFGVPVSGDTSMLSFNYNGSIVDSSLYATSAIYLTQGVLAFSTGATNAAPTERLRITSGGNVGINTTSPQSQLHIANNLIGSVVESTFQLGYSLSDYYGFKFVNASNPSATGAGLLKIQRGTGGSWVDALIINDNGNVGIGTTSPTQKIHVEGASLVTGKSYIGTTNIYFDFNGGSLDIATGGATKATLTSVGNFGIGTTSPVRKLEVYNTNDDLHFAAVGSAPSLNLFDTGSGPNIAGTIGLATGTNNFIQNSVPGDLCISTRGSANAAGYILFGSGSTMTAYISGSGDMYIAGALTQGSTRNIKENIAPISNALSIVTQIQGVTYDKIDGSAKSEPGFIAEDMYSVLPSLVSLDRKGDPQGIKYTNLTAYLLEAIKELKAEIDILKNET